MHRVVSCVFALLLVAFASSGCAEDDDVAKLAAEDLRCDTPRVFLVDGPRQVERPFFERGKGRCATYTAWWYRVEGCERWRSYVCTECSTGSKVCNGLGPVVIGW